MTSSLLTVAGHVSSSPVFPCFTASAALQSALVRLLTSSLLPLKNDSSLDRSPDCLSSPCQNTSSARGLESETSGHVGRLGKLIVLLADDFLRERVGYVHGGSRVERGV